MSDGCVASHDSVDDAVRLVEYLSVIGVDLEGDGLCWAKARQAARMASGGLGDLTAELLEDFALLFQSTVEQIKDAEVDPLKKAEAISRLSDAYTKTMRAAAKGAPEIGRLAIALEVLDALAKFVRAHHPEHAEALIEVLEPFGQELAGNYG
jgi:hypothetical protein